MSIIPLDVEAVLCEENTLGRERGCHIGLNVGGAMEFLLRSWVDAGRAEARVTQPLIWEVSGSKRGYRERMSVGGDRGRVRSWGRHGSGYGKSSLS